MSKPLEKELELLEKEGVISPEVAGNIRAYYQGKSANPNNRLFVVFAILGAILVGLGIILIIAHNWDELTRPVKVFFAFLPLVLGQFFCGFTLLKRTNNQGWKEGSSVFLFFAVGASISLISQVYNIHGDLGSFLFAWMLLCFPLIYLMHSSMASLLYIAGITYYAVESHTYWSLFSRIQTVNINYWWMLALIAPHYYRLYKASPNGNSMIFHNWVVPISLIIALGTLSQGHGNILYIAYMSMFGLFYLIGTSEFFQNVRRRVNGYLVLGSLGTVHILLMASFNWFWENIYDGNRPHENLLAEPEFLMSIVLSLAALVVLMLQYRVKKWEDFHPIKIIFLVFIVMYFAGLANYFFFPVLFVNFIVLATGIFTIRVGIKHDHLGILNYGLLTITALIICRFFDSNMSFIVRGLLFIAVGVGFFLANYLMLKKRKFLEAEKVKIN